MKRVRRTAPEAHNTQYIEAMATYDFIKKRVSGAVVLDAGCGFGYGTEHLAGYARTVVGVDVSEETLGWARKKYDRRNAVFAVSDISALGLAGGTFDCACFFETVHYIDPPGWAIAELGRVLKREGMLFLSTRRSSAGGRLMDMLAGAGFDVVETYGLYRPPEAYELEGRLESLRSADMLGIKKILPRSLISVLVYAAARLYGIKPPQKMRYEDFTIVKESGESSSPGVLFICRKR